MIYLISLVLVTLKLAGAITAPWLLVLLPIWGYLVIYLTLKAIGFKS